MISRPVTTSKEHTISHKHNESLKLTGARTLRNNHPVLIARTRKTDPTIRMDRLKRISRKGNTVQRT